MNAADRRYNLGARALHWTIAVLVIANLAIGLLHEPLEDSIDLIPVHEAIGITVLGLTLVRIAWRFTWKRPPFPGSVAPVEAWAARAVQGLFYVLTLALPLSGWVFASAGKYPISWFGIFTVPKFAVTRQDPIFGIAHEGHEIMGWVTIALVVLHVGAALRHHFLLKDNVLRRMM
ncbi:MAG: cytochrome b [Porphyrobacter sp.]|nr:cytochrome b [Porphyrobacter sp.]